RLEAELFDGAVIELLGELGRLELARLLDLARLALDVAGVLHVELDLEPRRGGEARELVVRHVLERRLGAPEQAREVRPLREEREPARDLGALPLEAL